MSIVVRDMKMPKGCLDPCPLLRDDISTEFFPGYGEVVIHDLKCGKTGTPLQDHEAGRMGDCPLFETQEWAKHREE